MTKHQRYNRTEKGRARNVRHNQTSLRLISRRRYRLKQARLSVLERLDALQAEQEGLSGSIS